MLDKMRLLPKFSELGSFFPKSVKWGVVQGSVETDNMSLSASPLKMFASGRWHLDEGFTFDTMGGPQVYGH